MRGFHTDGAADASSDVGVLRLFAAPLAPLPVNRQRHDVLRNRHCTEPIASKHLISDALYHTALDQSCNSFWRGTRESVACCDLLKCHDLRFCHSLARVISHDHGSFLTVPYPAPDAAAGLRGRARIRGRDSRPMRRKERRRGSARTRPEPGSRARPCICRGGSWRVLILSAPAMRPVVSCSLP